MNKVMTTCREFAKTISGRSIGTLMPGAASCSTGGKKIIKVVLSFDKLTRPFSGLVGFSGHSC